MKTVLGMKRRLSRSNLPTAFNNGSQRLLVLVHRTSENVSKGIEINRGLIRFGFQTDDRLLCRRSRDIVTRNVRRISHCQPFMHRHPSFTFRKLLYIRSVYQHLLIFWAQEGVSLGRFLDQYQQLVTHGTGEYVLWCHHLQ
jgi:hypothetical protein